MAKFNLDVLLIEFREPPRELYGHKVKMGPYVVVGHEWMKDVKGYPGETASVAYRHGRIKGLYLLKDLLGVFR